jgi:hypothetical protein
MPALNRNKISFIIFLGTIFCGGFLFASSAKAIITGDTKNFSLDPIYDNNGRSQSKATLVYISDKLFIYIDDSWWKSLSADDQSKAIINISNVSNEFQNNIYPKLTAVYGKEWNPGIDNDSHITVLLHPLRKGNGGYFNAGNEYSKIVVPASNEREMVYLNTDYISSATLSRLLAHEFTHLISFNQKERLSDIEEDVWLNEGRAEYSSTICGYDDVYAGSNLEKRVKEFLSNPSDSITNWQGATADYASANLFIQYLVDQYGVNILGDSLKSGRRGIDSLNYALLKNGFSDTFSDVFTNWTIAVFANNCSYGKKYCFKNNNLKTLKVLSISNFLVPDSKGFLSVNHNTQKWSGNWYKIFGNGDNLNFHFTGEINGNFKLPYILCDKNDSCKLQFLSLSQNQEGDMTISDFVSQYSYVVIIPSSQGSNSGAITFSWTAKSISEPVTDDQELIKSLLRQIEVLKGQIAAIQAKLGIKDGNATSGSCQINSDLFYGVSNASEVKCLQEFLKKRGADIYPEGIISGNFFELTKIAVIRFQNKYASEILSPGGFSSGTGFVGEMTRKKISQLNK